VTPPLSGTLPPVPRLRQAWYVLCTSLELPAGGRPLKRRLYGAPIVLFRGADGQPGALLDRCPHRDVPLSQGFVKGAHLQCAYHGWEFDCAGHCQRIPSLLGEIDKPARRATAYVLREQQGFVWAWGDPETEPVGEPFRFAYAERDDYLVVHNQVRAQASLHAVAENALDVPHTAFLHGGLFRNDKAERNRIHCVLTRGADQVECEYQGEPRPEGLVARLLSPSGGIVTHFDRFTLPCIVEVEYALGTENHIVNAAALTPADDYETVLYAVVAVKTRLPAWLVRPVVQPLALRIFRQDATILELQTASIEHFGQARYVSTEVDLLGPQILKLLTRAASGEGPGGDYRTEIDMEV